MSLRETAGRLSVRKLFAVTVSAAVLGAQLWAILPPGYRATQKNRYWPFLDYPMYSNARYRGAVIVQHRLFGIPCHGEGERPVTRTDLRTAPTNLVHLLWTVTAQVSADTSLKRSAFRSPLASALARDSLDAVVRLYLPGAFCRLKVKEQAVVVGESIPADLERLWVDLMEWELVPAPRPPR